MQLALAGGDAWGFQQRISGWCREAEWCATVDVPLDTGGCRARRRRARAKTTPRGHPAPTRRVTHSLWQATEGGADARGGRGWIGRGQNLAADRDAMRAGA